MLMPAMQAPELITRFDPNLSESHPVSGASIPPPKREATPATEVAARLKPSSEDIGLNNAENP